MTGNVCLQSVSAAMSETDAHPIACKHAQALAGLERAGYSGAWLGFGAASHEVGDVALVCLQPQDPADTYMIVHVCAPVMMPMNLECYVVERPLRMLPAHTCDTKLCIDARLRLPLLGVDDVRAHLVQEGRVVRHHNRRHWPAAVSAEAKP